MKYPEDEYLHYDPFEGDEAKIACRSVKLVKVRRPHPCFIGAHPVGGDKHVIQPGEVARVESALVDGSFWSRSYVCIACMDKWLDMINGEDDE